MKKLNRKERISFIAAGVLLLSIILMIIIIPGILNDKSHPNPELAVKGIKLAIIIHLVIFLGYVLIIGLNRRDGKKRKAGYITIGILLILFGLIYVDGAVAFSDNENILYVSYLMFASVGCDLIASILIFTAIFLKSKE